MTRRLDLFLILAIAAILRLSSVSFGLPNLYHADEPIIVNHALSYGTFDFNPHFFKIPPLVSYLLFLLYGLSYVAGHALGFFADIHAFEHLFYRDPTFFYFLARFVFGGLAGILSVYLLYRLIEQHFDRFRALGAGLLLATCFLHVRDSHYIYVDIPLVLVLIATFFAFFKILDRGNRKILVLICGCLIGLATAIKYNGVFLAVPFLYASLRSRHKEALFLKWSGAALAAVSVFVLLNPYAVLDWSFFLSELRVQAGSNSGVSVLHHLLYSLRHGLGLPLLSLALLGLLYRIRSAFRLPRAGESSEVLRHHKALTLLFFLFPYYGVLVFAAQPYDRYVLPLIPFLCFFAADCAARIAIVPAAFSGDGPPGPSRSYRSWLFLLIIAATALPGAGRSVIWNILMHNDDVRTQAQNWINENISRGSRIAMDGSFEMPRLEFSPAQIMEKRRSLETKGEFSAGQMRRLQYLLRTAPEGSGYHIYFLSDEADRESPFLFSNPRIPYSYKAIKDRGIQYLVRAYRGRAEDDHEAFWKEVEDQGVRVRRFSPYREPGRIRGRDIQPLTGGPFLLSDLLSRVANGETIDIYRLPD